MDVRHIARGIARKKVFDDDIDRDFLLERLGMIVRESQTHCFAWALIPNHFHLSCKTGATPMAAVMKRLLTGYAVHYNRRHKRYGHLFSKPLQVRSLSGGKLSSGIGPLHTFEPA